MDLEKTYGKWEIEKAFGELVAYVNWGGKLMKTVPAIYKDSKVCARVNGKQCIEFSIDPGVRYR